MRYPVVNLGARGGRMGGMLEDYQNEINNLKAKLNTGGYSQPGRTPVYMPPLPPPPPIEPPSSPPSAYAPAISVYTGASEEETLPPYPPNTVSTGIPPNLANPPWPPIDYGYPPIPPPGACPPGQTWTPSGCKPNVPSVDQYLPPPPEPTPTVTTTPPPPPSVETGMAPPSRPGVASVDCGPGRYWDGVQCQDLGTGQAPGGGGGLLNIATGGFFGGGGASGAGLFGRTVPIRSYGTLGGPAMARPIRLAGGRA